MVWALATWVLVYGAFFLWWEPDNIEFWIASLPPALLLLALALRGARRRGPEVWIAVAVAVTALGINYDAIGRRGRIRFVTARGEAGALNMADAHARVGGTVGVCVTSTGTGAGNAAGALVEAQTAGSPVLHLTGQGDAVLEPLKGHGSSAVRCHLEGCILAGNYRAALRLRNDSGRI